MDWDNIITTVNPYIVKIETPTGSGTGFLCSYNDDKSLCGIATAEHVVCDADKWLQPIRIHNHDFRKTKLFTESERFILTDDSADSAVILVNPSELDFPETLIQLRPKSDLLNIGSEVGWLGYPGLSEWTLCFFSGCISARRNNGYFIDGVAINGVSGGPVISAPNGGSPQFVGVISAYHPNRQAGGSLPGLLIAQDVSHFHNVIQMVQSLDEARRQKAEEDAKKKLGEIEAAPPAQEYPGTPA